MGRIVIDTEKCKSCGICVEACKDKCIAIKKEINSAGYEVAIFVEPDKCKACCICAELCPDVAIEVYK